MKVVFKGILETRSGGCVPCGAKRVSKQTMVTNKMYILPSGATKTFWVGRTEEVSDNDGAFLKSFTYTDKDGNVQPVFEEVK